MRSRFREIAPRRVILLAALSLLGCAGITGSGDDVPAWVAAMIRQMQAEPVANPEHGLPESFGAGLHYFTGSKPHNIAVRRLGRQRGLKINEYGVFRGR